MNTTYRTFACIICCCALLTACGNSPPHNYYLLSATPAQAARGDTPTLGVGPVAVPEYLARENLVHNRDGNTLRVSDSDYWAEPLAHGMARVMALNLAALLDTQGVRLYPWHSGRAPDYGFRMTVLSMDADATQASLVAEWLLYRPADNSVVARRMEQLRQPLQDNAAAAIAAAYSELLLQLSRTVAADIRADSGD